MAFGEESESIPLTEFDFHAVESDEAGELLDDMESETLTRHQAEQIIAWVRQRDENERPESRGVLDVIRIVFATIISPPKNSNSRLEAELLGLVVGFPGLGTMEAIGRRHGLTKAAISDRALKRREQLKLPPSCYMRSEAARKVYKATNGRRRPLNEQQGKGSKRDRAKDEQNGRFFEIYRTISCARRIRPENLTPDDKMTLSADLEPIVTLFQRLKVDLG